MSKAQYINPQVGMESHESLANRLYGYGQALNGGIDFGQSTETSIPLYSGNMKGIWANVTAPATPNTEFAITHNLGYVPSHYPIVNADRACKVYQLPNTGTAWTNTQIFVKCDTASAVLRVFIQ